MSRDQWFADTPWIVAHRGARDEAPENTRTAFDRALDAGVDGIEFDVQISKDGVPVIYHDRTLYQVSRRRRRVGDQTLEQLRQIDWGEWFASDFAGEPLLTLDEMLHRYAGRTRLLLEIKSRKIDRSTGRSDRLVTAVVEAVDRAKEKLAAGQLFILSFDPDVLAAIHHHRAHLPCVLNLELPRGESEGIAALESAINTIEAPLAAIDVPIKRIRPAFGNTLHERDVALMTYSCNTQGQVDKAVSAGVDVIMTDRPKWIMENPPK